VTPKSSWSVDPFGHGGTFPYILKSSGVDGMVIMRIHYAWKEYFAIQQTGDFMWQQRWDTSGKYAYTQSSNLKITIFVYFKEKVAFFVTIFHTTFTR